MAIVRRFLNTSKLVNISLNITLLLLAVGAALLVGSVMIMLMDADPIKAYQALYEGAFGTTNSRAETLVKATPLLFVGIGICVAFRGGVINVGGEGQMIIGALAGVWIALSLDTVPRFIENVPINDFPQITVVTLSLLAGFVAGALWGGIAGVLKAYFGVNEILSTIMLNQIALQLMNYLLNGVLLDPEQKDRVNRIPKTARIEEHAKLPRIDWFSDTPTRLHAGLIVGLVLAVVVYILLWRTTLGYRIRAVGQSDRASRYAGINVKRQVLYSILISGGCAGLAGAVQVIGLQYRLQTDGSAAGFTGNAGFNGIVAALFGGLHPIGTIPASVFFGALLIGAQSIQREVQVPASLITTLNGLVVIFVVSSQIFIKRLTKRRASVPPQPTPAAPKSLPALQEEAAK
ncbi:MAG: ABC transporter permease [Chloroflexi bacterium]|nr:ABC transporter permease [Chloroflexota bacterium]